MQNNDDKIHDEIRKRVLEVHQRRQQEEEIKLQSEATVEALHDITGISKTEIQRIADEVRAEMQHVSPKKDTIKGWLKKYKKQFLGGLALIILLLFLSNTPLIQRITSSTRSVLPQQSQNQSIQGITGDKEMFPPQATPIRHKRARRHFRGRD